VAVFRSAEAASSGARIVAALARPGRADKARASLGDVAIVESLTDLLSQRPTIVAEVAGQQAVVEYGETVLRSGVDFLVIAIGALAEPALFERLKSAARDGKARLLLPAGAIGGIDAIAAMRLAGLTSVRYRSVKPPVAWRGTPAEQGFLHDVEEGACAMFSTVLAPGSNAYHEDHMHLDLMRRQSGRAVCQPHALPGEAAAFLSGSGHHAQARPAGTMGVAAGRGWDRSLLQAIARDR